MDAAHASPKVSCPTCGETVVWSGLSPWRPFCSERCRLLDLGAWFSEERAIPDEKLQGSADSGDLPVTTEPGRARSHG
jgi:endogenous inhibitor of DNA gyrase (YacG/DUF329 family)